MPPIGGGLMLALLFCTGVLLVAASHETPTREAPTKPVSEAVAAQEAAQIQAQVRTAFKIPEVFDFACFKRTFNKHYRSPLEELVRLKLFMARAHEAVVSAVKYWYRKAKYHLRVNQYSDWTDGEIEATRNHEMSSEVPEGLKVIQLDAEVGVEGSSGTQATEDELQRERQPRSKRAVTTDQSSDSDATDKMSLEELEWLPGYRGVQKIVKEFPGGRDDYHKLPVKGNHIVNDLRPAERAWNFVARASSGVLQLLWPWQSSGSGASELSDVVWVDHRTKSDCLMPVQAQGNCGACYAFVTTAFLEWAICRSSGDRLKLSEQYLIDCGRRLEDLHGCNGGSYTSVALFTQNYGLELADFYPYKERAEQCPYGDDVMVRRWGYLRTTLHAIAKIPLAGLEEELVRWPIMVGINGAGDFQRYGGGVWSGRHCVSKSTHGMLMIGHGREDGEEYWLLQNSFGLSWGEQGYMKLNKNSKCLQANESYIFANPHIPYPNLFINRNPIVRWPIKEIVDDEDSE